MNVPLALSSCVIPFPVAFATRISALIKLISIMVLKRGAFAVRIVLSGWTHEPLQFFVDLHSDRRQG